MPYLYGTYGQIGDTKARLGVSTDTVPVYFGTAPVNLVRGYKDAGLVNRPIKIKSLADAQINLGYADEWDRYTLCEAIAAHFDNGGDGVGPIYVLNVLDPDTHRKEEQQTATLTFANGKAMLMGSDVILDSVKIPRPALENAAQAVKLRGKGEGANDKGFDYAKAYAAAGVKLNGTTFEYEPTGVIDEKLYHDGVPYVGLVFTKPEGATKVTLKINGQVISENVDLGKNGDEVISGEFVHYFAFAKPDGSPMDPGFWDVQLEWTGGETHETRCAIARDDGMNYQEGTDYTLTYSTQRGGSVIEDINGVFPRTLEANYSVVDATMVTADDVIGEATADGDVTGIAALKLMFMEQHTIANLLAAPGWSHIPEVYRALASASRQVNGHWDAFFVADLPLEDDEGNPIDTMADAVEWKQAKLYNDERSKACWPMAMDATGRLFHLSTLAVVEFLRIDQMHDGVPFETCSNKVVPMVKQWFGTDSRNKGFDQKDAEEITQKGIMTVVPWAGTWVLWGDHTAAYEYGNDYLDARAVFDTSLRMLMHITNSFQREWADEIDQPMTRALRDTIINVEQEKLDRLVSIGALLGNPRVEFSEEDNTNDDLLNGNFTWTIDTTPTPPLKSATVVVSYTDAGLSVFWEEV